MIVTVEQALREFHRAKVIHGGILPAAPTTDVPAVVRDFRIALLEEEVCRELIPALKAGDIVGIADGAADAVVAVVGMAVRYGIPFDRVFAEVCRSNMTKTNDLHQPKLVKGPGYEPPEIEAILRASGWRR